MNHAGSRSGILQALGWLNRLVDQYVNITNRIGTVVILVAMLLTVADTLGRFAFDSPIPGVLEMMGWYALPLIALFGLAALQKQHGHIRVTVLDGALGSRTKFALRVFRLIIALAIASLICWQDALLIAQDWKGHFIIGGILPLPLYIARVIVFIAFSAYGIQLVRDLIGCATHARQMVQKPQEST